jgi:tetratricopeptide (TPR) repeat protein
VIGIGLLAGAFQLAIVAHATIDTAAPVNFHAMVVPDTVFVGQQVTYQVGVFLDDELRLRLRRNPEFVPPEPREMLTYDLPGGVNTAAARRVGAHDYEVHVFERAMFPLASGHFTIPAAQLTYSLPLSLSFFSREESHTLAAESLSVTVLPPPAAGRPSDFSGAVGDFRVATRFDAQAVRAGDPVMLTVAVEGRGNVKLLPRPALTVPWGSAVAGEERVRIDTMAADVRGTKEFDWVVTPRDTGALVLPPVRYPYFNPYTERYEVALGDPRTLRVGQGSLAPVDSARADLPTPLAIRAVYHGELPAPPYTHPGFALVAAFAPLPALLLSARRLRRRRKPPPSAATMLRAVARRRGVCEAPAVRRAFVNAMAERFALSPAALAEPGGLARVLRREGVTEPTRRQADELLTRLDQAAYGHGDPVTPAMRARAYEIYRAVVGEARALMILLVFLVVGVGSTIMWAGTEAPAATEFHEGLVDYAARDYQGAAARFAAAARLAPRAADAWANAGTAAWALADSADAVVGWQRAARLQPFATDVRERLALIRAPQDGAIAAPPRVDAGLAAEIALACWLLACLLWAARAARRGQGFGRAVSFTVALTVACALAAAWLDEASAAKDLAVVNPGAALYATPALGAEHSVTLDAGDVARVQGRDGAWSRVRLDGDRDGWIESERLTSIAQ